MPKVKSKFSHITWLREREISHKFPLGSMDNFYTRLYTSVYPVGAWDHRENLRNAVHGGVFNLEFSPDGKLLVAACEKKSILMFDPLSQRMIHGIDDAHTECVNCVRFLDSRVFATCSDDTTVALWDARNLKQRIHTLRGHKNWVKNIEFSSKDGLLVTSGFDGSIYTWDINNYTEKRVFHTNGLMRTRLNPDATKMILCTTAGYIMIIHDLNLASLPEDLKGFKPNMYRLMQRNQTIYPGSNKFTRLFSKKQKRNRVEFIADFPKRVEAEVISSLQIHPQGWCTLSRHVSNDETSEWTCVHDIQDLPNTSEDTDTDTEDNGEEKESTDADATSSPNGEEEDSRRIQRTSEIIRNGSTYTANVELHLSSSDVWEAIVAVREARMSRQRDREAPQARENDGSRFAHLLNRQLDAEVEGFRNVTGSMRNTTDESPTNTLRDGRRSPRVDLDAISQSANSNQHSIQQAQVVGENPNGLGIMISGSPAVPSIGRPFAIARSTSAASADSAGVVISTAPRRSTPLAPAHAPIVPPINYDALATALRRSEEARAARLSRVQNIDVNQQMPVIRGLPASLVRNIVNSTEPRPNVRDSLVNGSVARVEERVRHHAESSELQAGHGSYLYSAQGNVLAHSLYPRSDRVQMWRTIGGVNTIVVPAGEGSSVDISISTVSSSSRSRDDDQDDGTSQSDSSQRTIPFFRSDDSSTRSGSASHTIRMKTPIKFPVHQNVPRLLNYIEEPNVGKGFIKELCFSSDGRLICSPFAFGVRLLAFTPDCSELSASVGDAPRQLYELKTNICHGNTVLSTKFSPQHCLLVSGCLNGKIVWHQPNIW